MARKVDKFLTIRGLDKLIKNHDYAGKFVVIEGGDGAGTTTQAQKIAKQKEYFFTAEPGERRKQKSLIGEKVEEMISSDKYSAEAIALAFAADRQVHFEDIIIPKLEKGKNVVCDRNYHSSLVYQTVLGAKFEWVKKINRNALKPDLTIILDAEAETAMQRVEDRGDDGNIFEEMNFQEEVVARYRMLSDKLDENIVYVDASRPIEKVYNEVEKLVSNLE